MFHTDGQLSSNTLLLRRTGGENRMKKGSGIKNGMTYCSHGQNISM